MEQFSSAEVQRKLTHMVRFIEQEAHEKADEIDAKGEEEYNILKGTYINEGRLKLNREYEAKERLTIIAERQFISRLIQNQKIRLLNIKIGHLEQIRQGVIHRFRNETLNYYKYSKILYKLILEGVYMLLEKWVKIRCRKQDCALIEKIIPQIRCTYQSKLNENIVLVFDDRIYLDEKHLGVILFTANNQCSANNTMTARIEAIVHNCIPNISTLLYGTSRFRTHI